VAEEEEEEEGHGISHAQRAALAKMQEQPVALDA
jgi:hypothetical protein